MLLALTLTLSTVVSDATGAALQGDVARAQKLLRSVPAEDLHAEDRAFRECMLERFQLPVAPSSKITDPFARKVLTSYQSYWNAALLKRENAESQLLDDLRATLERPAVSNLDDLEPLLRDRLRGAGYFSLQGRTGPLRELMMWTKQDERVQRVELPEGAQEVRVVLLDDFVSLGWADYATCGRRGAGGWAKPDALYAVVPRYKSLDAEEFRVTFLGHEAQHFADLARFPGLASWELEYRAKLVELAQADETRPKVLRKFSEDQGDDPASPHSYANKRVLAALRARLGETDLATTPIANLQAAAAAELREDSARRVKPRSAQTP